MGRARVLKPMKRENRKHMAAEELPDFLKALDDATTDHALMPLAVRFHLLTFVRPDELRGARWDEIDEAKALWSIPAARMKKKRRDHVVPLSKPALEVLSKLRPLTGNQSLLFPGRIQGKPFSDVAHIKAVKKLSNGKSTPHGFRHTASTILHEKDFPSDHVEMQLSHMEKNKVKGTYNKALYLDQRREMMQWWADYLDGVRDAKG
jgi:integrase